MRAAHTFGMNAMHLFALRQIYIKFFFVYLFLKHKIEYF